MSTPTRPNGYFLADTNSLVYAYRAGGTRQLDTYFRFAEEQGREFAITTTVADEIENGPLKRELGRYIADKKIPVLPTPKLERQLGTGQVVSKNAGEASILEVAAEEHTKGRSTLIWSEDKFFENPQTMRGAQGAEPVKTSQLLDQMRDGQFITDAEYRRTQARYRAAVPQFKPTSASHSQRLATFDGPAPRVLDHLGAADARIAAKPGFQTLVKGGSALGAAGMVYGGISTTREAIHQLDEGNVTGAQSQVMHFGTSVAGGALAGAAMGAAYGAGTGFWAGPGAVVTGLAGGVLGAVAGDKIMDAADRARIYNQRGSDSNLWHYDEQHPEHGWSRTEQVRALDAQGRPKVALGMPVVQTLTTTADAHLADELNYKASSVAVELVLAHPPAPQDPFRQAPERIGETVRAGVIGADHPWIRDVQSQTWTRQIIEPATPMTHGMPVQRTVTASPDQSRQLDAAAQRVIADNIAHSPQGIAQRYQEAYGQHGWRQHGPVPAAVINAAQGHVREELNATRQPMPAQPQPTSGPLTPQQIERITTHELRIVPTPGGMSFAEAHQRRDEPEQISAGSLQPVGKLDASHQAKGSPLYRTHQAQGQDLVRGLGIAQAQDRERFRNEPSPQQRPSAERTQDRTHRHLLEEAPVQKQPALLVRSVQTPPPTRGEPAMAPVAQDHVNPARPAAAEQRAAMPADAQSMAPSAAADIAAAQAQVAAAQAELAEMRQQMARMAGQRGPDGLQLRDESDQRQTAQPPAATSRPELRIDHPGHPGYELFQQAREHMRAMDARMGRASDQRTDNMAACLAVQACRSGLERIDGVDIGTSGKDVWMAQGPLGTVWMKVAGVPVESADVPVQQTSQRWEQAQQFVQQQQADKQLEQQAHQRARQQGNEHLVPSP